MEKTKKRLVSLLHNKLYAERCQTSNARVAGLKPRKRIVPDERARAGMLASFFCTMDKTGLASEYGKAKEPELELLHRPILVYCEDP